ncbi:MAG: THxN family PEP-CTERM protein, partial [Roseobacter sp.]
MNMKKYTATALVALTLTATNAYANTLTVDSVTGVWENAVADPVGGTISGTGTSTITWGNPSGQPQQSGYTFVGAAPPSVTFNEGEQFLLGTFTHNNFPITGTSLDTVDLQVSIGIAGHACPVETVFSFDHFETPNNANPCAGGGPNPCGDVVTTTLNTGMSETFDIDGVEYIFNVLGFSTDMGV